MRQHMGAGGELLPRLLVNPPWARKIGNEEPVLQPVVVSGLTVPESAEAAWLEGEREAWQGDAGPVGRERPAAYWAQLAAEIERRPEKSNVRKADTLRAGPAEVVVPLLRIWNPDDLLDGVAALRPLAAVFGTAALPLLCRVAARQPMVLGGLLLPFRDAGTAELLAGWVGRGLEAGETARRWAVRHGAEAVPLLLPLALAPHRPEGRWVERKRGAGKLLRLIAESCGMEAVLAASRPHGPLAVAGAEALLAVDKLMFVPERIPKFSDWLLIWMQLDRLPPISLRGGGAKGGEVLPDSAVRHLLTALALSTPGEPCPGLPDALAACRQDTLAEFGWALFTGWRNAHLPARDVWVLHALGLLGDDETVRRLSPVLRMWPGEGAHKRAVQGLEVLAVIGTESALIQLNSIAQRVKFKGLRARALTMMEGMAEGLGLSADQLADRLLPDLGLDVGGSTVIDYGPRKFTVRFDEELHPLVLDRDGTPLKVLPRPGAKDDPELAPAEWKRFAVLKREARALTVDQVRRLERAMCSGRAWSDQEFHAYLLAHPLVRSLVRRLLWSAEGRDGDVALFRVDEVLDAVDLGGAEAALPSYMAIRIVHPARLDDRQRAAWAQVFTELGPAQPFPQLDRPVLRLTQAEAARGDLPRFAGAPVPTGRLVGLERRGWVRGEPLDGGWSGWTSKELAPGVHLVLEPESGIQVSGFGMAEEQRIRRVGLAAEPGPQGRGDDGAPALRFGDLDVVTVSEVLLELTELTAGRGPGPTG